MRGAFERIGTNISAKESSREDGVGAVAGAQTENDVLATIMGATKEEEVTFMVGARDIADSTFGVGIGAETVAISGVNEDGRACGTDGAVMSTESDLFLGLGGSSVDDTEPSGILA